MTAALLRCGRRRARRVPCRRSHRGALRQRRSGGGRRRHRGRLGAACTPTAALASHAVVSGAARRARRCYRAVLRTRAAAGSAAAARPTARISDLTTCDPIAGRARPSRRRDDSRRGPRCLKRHSVLAATVAGVHLRRRGTGAADRRHCRGRRAVGDGRRGRGGRAVHAGRGDRRRRGGCRRGRGRRCVRRRRTAAAGTATAATVEQAAAHRQGCTL
jgi:hypothetical protein